MNTTFSFNRLGLLLKRFFIENKQRELTYWGIMILLFCLIHSADSVRMILYITGFIFAAKQFKIFTYTPSGMHYLLIPATHFEKLVANILLTTVYYFTMTMLTFIIGNIIGTSIQNILFSTSNPVAWDLFNVTYIHSVGNNLHINDGNTFLEMVVTFLTVQSIFMLGSLYFKRNALGKTMLSIFAIFLTLGIIELIIYKGMFGTMSLTGSIVSINFNSDNSSVFKALGYVYEIFGYLLIPFLWVVSYFRLTEKQV